MSERTVEVHQLGAPRRGLEPHVAGRSGQSVVGQQAVLGTAVERRAVFRRHREKPFCDSKSLNLFGLQLLETY